MKQILYVGLLLVAGFFLAGSTTTHAACAYPGFLNSDGQCAVSYSASVGAPYQYSNQFQYQYTAPSYRSDVLVQNYINRLLALLERLYDLQAQLDGEYTPISGRSAVDVTTRSAIDVRDDQARLRGEVDFNREDEATVYFQWGESRTRLNEETTHIVLDEDDDDEDFSQVITRLDDNETYYFRAVAEDERNRRDYGAIFRFRTDDDDHDDDDDYPDVETGDADDITDDSAEIYGEVDMNDFNNGLAFFVWGEDEDQVADIEDDYDEYRDIDEDGDDLQKTRVDTDVGGELEAWATIYGLDDDTRIYYNFCVEFEDEDDDETIECGGVEDFRTDD